MVVLRANDLTLPELLALLGVWEAGRIWLDAPDGWSLAHWPGLANKLPWCRAGHDPGEVLAIEVVSRSTAGRLFDDHGELQWRKLLVLGESTWRTVYLGAERDSVASLPSRTELKGLEPKRSEHPLWGILTASSRRSGTVLDEWVELRIPHRFRYPVEVPTPRPMALAVKAIIETWRDNRGETHFMRLCDLLAYPAGE
ncbi:MAG: hypothetical protein RMJ52_15235 [Gemmataceae bacterium]|nr:hypothetical protein [Gemmataceae bacterium]